MADNFIQTICNEYSIRLPKFPAEVKEPGVEATLITPSEKLLLYELRSIASDIYHLSLAEQRFANGKKEIDDAFTIVKARDSNNFSSVIVNEIKKINKEEPIVQGTLNALLRILDRLEAQKKRKQDTIDKIKYVEKRVKSIQSELERLNLVLSSESKHFLLTSFNKSDKSLTARSIETIASLKEKLLEVQNKKIAALGAQNPKLRAKLNPNLVSKEFNAQLEEIVPQIDHGKLPGFKLKDQADREKLVAGLAQTVRSKALDLETLYLIIHLNEIAEELGAIKRDLINFESSLEKKEGDDSDVFAKFRTIYQKEKSSLINKNSKSVQIIIDLLGVLGRVSGETANLDGEKLSEKHQELVELIGKLKTAKENYLRLTAKFPEKVRIEVQVYFTAAKQLDNFARLIDALSAYRAHLSNNGSLIDTDKRMAISQVEDGQIRQLITPMIGNDCMAVKDSLTKKIEPPKPPEPSTSKPVVWSAALGAGYGQVVKGSDNDPTSAHLPTGTPTWQSAVDLEWPISKTLELDADYQYTAGYDTDNKRYSATDEKLNLVLEQQFGNSSLRLLANYFRRLSFVSDDFISPEERSVGGGLGFGQVMGDFKLIIDATYAQNIEGEQQRVMANPALQYKFSSTSTIDLVLTGGYDLGLKEGLVGGGIRADLAGLLFDFDYLNVGPSSVGQLGLGYRLELSEHLFLLPKTKCVGNQDSISCGGALMFGYQEKGDKE